MNAELSPPQWADFLLRASLAPRDVETVSGDLLEEYRLQVLPMRQKLAADVWYVNQAVCYAWRRVAVFAVMFALAFLARTALDWRMPVTDFHVRSTVTTFASMGILLLAGFAGGVRSGSSRIGALSGFVAAAFAVPIQLLGTIALLAVWHDPLTLSAIQGSGGLGEVITLPLLTVIPAIVLGGVGGALGAAGRRFRLT